MKVSSDKIISGLVVGTTLVLTSFLINTPAKAEPVPLPVNGLFHSTTIDFFYQGRVKFEKELNLLVSGKIASEPVLTKSPDLQPVQEQLKPLEKSDNLPYMRKSGQAE
jgi:hypothetical protein